MMATLIFFIQIALTAISVSGLQGNGSNLLEPYSTLYLPSSYDNAGNAVYEYGGDAIEDAAYDQNDNLVYTAGDAFINIIDVKGITSPQILHYQRVSTDTPAVTICGSYVIFLSKSSITDYEDGTVSIYNKYDRANPGVFEQVNEIKVGPGPESVAFTQDCRTVVVANAATPEANMRGTDILDPEGSVSILEFEGGNLSNLPKSNTKVYFDKFNNRWEEYVARGVRFVYRGQLSITNSTLFSQDLTPEYVVLNNQGTKAYVCLQINNAIAVIDIATRSVDEIYPLGTKSWNALEMDVTDRDGGINFGRWPIKTLYQPDEIGYFETGGSGYIVTANEGDPFHIELETPQRQWTDAKIGGEFKDSELSPNLDSRIRDALNDNMTLKYHEFSTIDGLDANGKIQELHGFGGRGISVYRVSDFKQVYDSGDAVAKLHAQVYPEVFNADDEPASLSPEQLKDMRSPKQGVDCESIAIGEIDGERLVFIGADRIGTLMVFSLKKNSYKPQLEFIFRNGSTDRPIRDLLNDRDLNDAAPEALTFIPANANSAVSFPMLMVAGTESGTLSFYRINYSGNSAASLHIASNYSLVILVAMVAQLILNHL